MRWIGATVLLVMAGVASASGQVLWVGIADGTSWDWQPKTSPGQNFLHNNSAAPSWFVAFPIDNDTYFRLGAATVNHETAINGQGWPGKLQAYTMGVDYFFPGVFGRSLVSAGFGSYRQHLAARQPPPGYDEAKLGWYGTVGEWFELTRRTRFTADVTVHRTPHQGGTTVFVVSAGLAAWF